MGPPQIAIHQGQTVLVSEQNGQVGYPSDKGLHFLEAISESMRNGLTYGLDGRARCDSGQVFEALPETSCGRRPPVRSIAARDYAMEVT